MVKDLTAPLDEALRQEILAAPAVAAIMAADSAARPAAATALEGSRKIGERFSRMKEDLVGLATQYELLFEDWQASNMQLRKLNDLATRMNESLHLEEVLQQVVALTLEITKAERGFIVLKSQDRYENLVGRAAFDQFGKPLPQKLDPETLAAYQATLTGLGLPANAFDAFEPWFAGVTLSVLPLTKHGYDPNQGVEKQLTAKAKAGAKPISGFETLTEQLGFFDTLPEVEQVSFLKSVVKDIDKLGPQLDKMVLLWGKGDPDGLAVTMNESMEATPELAKTLLFDRNARWADQIKTRLDKPGTVFVAVGAGHLAGQKSVQDYLKGLGVRVQRVQ